jgi:hypothetical protein
VNSINHAKAPLFRGFKAFKDIQYDGPFTFETTRRTDPQRTAIYNMNVVDFFKQNAESDV